MFQSLLNFNKKKRFVVSSVIFTEPESRDDH